VVQIRFNEWTTRGVVRQPVFVGFRDDKDPREVVREPVNGEHLAASGDAGSASPDRRAATAEPIRAVSLDSPVARQIRALQKARKGGTLTIGRDRLGITNPGKIFFPKKKVTKGDLLAYYAEMADLILPWMA